MGLNPQAKRELQRIIARDYGFTLSDEQAETLGLSLLRLTRLALRVRQKAI